MKTPNDSEAGDERKAKPEKTVNTCALSLRDGSIVATAIVTVRNPVSGLQETTRVILDTASHRTYATESIANRLNLKPCDTETLEVAVFGSRNVTRLASNAVPFDVLLKNGDAIPIVGHTTSLITDCDMIPRYLDIGTAEIIESMKTSLADDFNNTYESPQILVGGEYFWEFITGPKITLSPGLFLVASSFALLLVGRYVRNSTQSLKETPTLLCLTERRPGSTEPALATISTVMRDCKALPDVDEFFLLERIGISDDPVTSDDQIAMQQFKESVRFVNGRYEMGWPRRANIDTLPDNYSLSIGRLRSLLRRLKRMEPKITEEYQNVVKQQEDMGIIEAVPPHQIRTTNLVHYLPHHPVVKLNHTSTEVRIVYDASARVQKDAPSLNECLYRGPVLLPDLCSILLRFRTYPIAIVADIEKAFLQLSLRPEDRDLTRFFWIHDASKLTDENNLKLYRFCRVPFGVISSPFLLSATIQHHLDSSNPSSNGTISRDMYVDNMITGTNDVESSILLYHRTKSVFSKASMNLRDYCSNSEELLREIPVGDISAERSIRVLGLRWDSRSDKLKLQGNWVGHEKCNTKRKVLQAVASIFDPLGLFQPVTLPAKCFLRAIWDAKLSWDQELDDAMKNRWAHLYASIAPIFDIRFNRQVSDGLVEESTIVAFSDASMTAYAAVVFLRQLADAETAEGDVVTLPKLELLGLTIAVRAAEFVRNSLAQDVRIYLLCDSTAVLGWLESSRQLPVFIKNRVKQIRQLKNAEFHHVSGSQNPADLATRGINGSELIHNQLRRKGPEWLCQGVQSWPTNQSVNLITDNKEILTTETEHIPRQAPIYHALVTAEGPSEITLPLSIDLARFSFYSKLRRVTALCIRVLKRRVWQRLSQKTKNKYSALDKVLKTEDGSNGAPTAKELETAGHLWIRSVQLSAFAELQSAIERKQEHKLKQLDPRR